MKNLDIYILTSVMVILFLVFIIGIYRAVKDADMLKLVGKMFDNENIPNNEKKVIYKAIHRTIADMENSEEISRGHLLEAISYRKKL